MNKLIDRFDREIRYLRISVTDRCDLRCIYCMPKEGILRKTHEDILSFEEIYRIVKVSAGLGVWKIRITGGEPLVRKGLPLLISRLKTISGLKEIALTTNGLSLKEYASSLKAVGLDRINISLDSLIPERFSAITRGGNLSDCLIGIESAFSAGFETIKINTVLLRNFNTDEITDIAELTREQPINVRFIECMPTGLVKDDLFFSCSEAKKALFHLGTLEPVTDENHGPAKVYRLNGFRGTVGFISPMSEPFCSTCDKLRMTADGRLRSCLHSSRAVDLRKAIMNGASDEGLATIIREAVMLKPRSHNLTESPLGAAASENFSMCQIGG